MVERRDLRERLPDLDQDEQAEEQRRAMTR